MKLVKDYPPETQWQTRTGLPVRILCADAPGDYPVIGYMTERDGRITTTMWGEEGRFGYADGNCDLIPVPVKRTGWVNLYPPDHQYCDVSTHGVCRTKEDADYAASVRDIPRVACIQIEWTEGEGLS